MKKNKLFGANINPNCSYCDNAAVDEAAYCKKKKSIQNGKCKYFKYDPLMRVPKISTFKKTYTTDDFKL